MTSKSQKHSVVGFLQLSGKKSARGVLSGLALLGLFLVAPAHAAVFTVNSPADPRQAMRTQVTAPARLLPATVSAPCGRPFKRPTPYQGPTRSFCRHFHRQTLTS